MEEQFKRNERDLTLDRLQQLKDLLQALGGYSLGNVLPSLHKRLHLQVLHSLKHVLVKLGQFSLMGEGTHQYFNILHCQALVGFAPSVTPQVQVPLVHTRGFEFGGCTFHPRVHLTQFRLDHLF